MDSLLPEAFALVREARQRLLVHSHLTMCSELSLGRANPIQASMRVLGLRHFDVQLMGGGVPAFVRSQRLQVQSFLCRTGRS